MNNNFRIRICSDLDYEEMVADICFKNNTIAIVSQEKGIDNMEIEILITNDALNRKFPLDEFIEVVAMAKKCLIEMQKLPEE
jgi:hypothetical protein